MGGVRRNGCEVDFLLSFLFFLDWRFGCFAWDTFLHVEKEERERSRGGGCRHTQRKANIRTERIIFDHA